MSLGSSLFTAYISCSNPEPSPRTRFPLKTGSLGIYLLSPILACICCAITYNIIYCFVGRQICESGTPLHPVMPGLVEVYVNSIFVPHMQGGQQGLTNEPLSEDEILSLFESSFPAKTRDVAQRSRYLGLLCALH